MAERTTSTTTRGGGSDDLLLAIGAALNPRLGIPVLERRRQERLAAEQRQAASAEKQKLLTTQVAIAMAETGDQTAAEWLAQNGIAPEGAQFQQKEIQPSGDPIRLAMPDGSEIDILADDPLVRTHLAAGAKVIRDTGNSPGRPVRVELPDGSQRDFFANDSRIQPLLDQGGKFVPISQAQPDEIRDLQARIIKKVANNKPLTQAEQRAFDMSVQTSAMNALLAGSLGTRPPTVEELKTQSDRLRFTDMTGLTMEQAEALIAIGAEQGLSEADVLEEFISDVRRTPGDPVENSARMFDLITRSKEPPGLFERLFGSDD